MLLGASGVQVPPETLASRVYLPKRRGSLQAELFGASRSYGRIPYRIDSGFTSLVGELQAGRPVLILQNLGLQRFPIYHYCVVVGVTTDNTVVLRSGAKKRVVMGVGAFLRSWKKAGEWGMILLKPGHLPASPAPLQYIKAVRDFEKAGNEALAMKAYQAAVLRWPNQQTALFALGNSFMHHYRYADALDTFLTLLRINPEHIGGANNLAEALSRTGCNHLALSVLYDALESAARTNSPLRPFVLQTHTEISNKISRTAGQDPKKCVIVAEELR